MRSSNRLMSFPAGTMVTVKGYSFVLRDAAAVMGTPEDFGEAMCELAKAEQMQDQAMDSVKMVVELTREAVEAAKKLFPAKGEIAATPDYMVPTWSNAPERKPNAETVAALQEALATRKGKIAPVANPDLVYDENGLWIREQSIQKGHSYSVNNGFGYLGQVAFQDGPVPEHGVNGLTNEALLAILIHRTNILNERFPCNENSEALVLMTQAKQVFESRTKRRQAAGIEGKMVEQST